MEVAGKSTIHPALFIAGKGAGYFAWVSMVMVLTGVIQVRQKGGIDLNYIAYPVLFTGIILIFISSFTLGKSIRIGLPTEKTVLKTKGIYRFSRNPMYLGVHLVTLAAMLVIPLWWVVLPGLFSYYVYHRIVLNEEIFLLDRFGNEYIGYKFKVRRYL